MQSSASSSFSQSTRAFGLSGGVCKRAGRAEHGDLRHAEGRGHVHQARVVAGQAARRGDERHRVEQRGLAGEHATGARGRGGDRFAERRFALRSEQDDERAIGRVQRAGERRVVLGRPALGRPVLGAGREDPEAAGRQRRRGEGRRDRRLVELQARPRSDVEIGAGQRAVERHHGRPPLRISQALVEQEWPALAGIADASRNARQPRQQRRLDRIGQHIGRIETTAQRGGDAATRRPVESAVRERQLDDLRHLRHRPEHRRDPRQRRDGQRFAPRRQRGEQRLGHHRIADPLRRDDERARRRIVERASHERCARVNASGSSRPLSAGIRCRSTGICPSPWKRRR